MSNLNLSSSLVIICLMIVSSHSILICKAGAPSEVVGIRRLGTLLGRSTHDMPQTTAVDNPKKVSNRPPLKGVQPITKGEEFNYLDGNPSGPKNWGNLNPEWKICANGKSQSPVNIDVKRAQIKPDNLKRNYINAPARIINGHNNIGVEWLGDAGGIEVNGSIYKLVQCHWHTPSEHTIDGKKFDAELHLLHKNDKGQRSVVSTLHTIGPLDPFIEILTEKIQKLGANEEIHLGNISANIIRHGSKRNYRYIGSFTTPPCTEDVMWTIADKVRTISKGQIKLLKGLHQREYQENARPTQQLRGRSIWKFDSPDEKE